ncbi:uncharacterized protein LOC133314214 [Gastrolobium bilobum]|uniref:uncharacterized protein LOC133314214 n=1 Tax=Gastrolobium bilobum TaxID=150636 RepID=UPI002AB3136A|nr:uncharacterized protein LOC133314214 [Gastrolobium bilobum]
MTVMSMLSYFVLYTVSATSANFVAQVNMISMLNGSNFKLWKEHVEIFCGCMDLYNALRFEKPTSTPKNPNTDKVEKWERSNRMYLMIMKCSVPKAFRGSIVETTDAKMFLKELEQYFARNEKAEIGQTLSNLINMRYNGKRNIREYIMEMSNLAGKLEALKLELPCELLMYLVIISLPSQYGQFVVPVHDIVMEHASIPDITLVQDNNEPPPLPHEEQTQQIQEVPVRRSIRERRNANPDDYIVFLQ